METVESTRYFGLQFFSRDKEWSHSHVIYIIIHLRQQTQHSKECQIYQESEKKKKKKKKKKHFNLRCILVKSIGNGRSTIFFIERLYVDLFKLY